MENLKLAIKTLGIYTAGRFDLYALAGSAKGSCRAHVMSDLLGIKTPISKSGITALREKFYELAKIDADVCDAERESRFIEHCRSIVATEK